MNRETVASAVVIVVFISMVLSAAIAGCIENQRWEREAVRQGAAEWRARPDGGVVFTWTTKPEAVTDE